MKRATRRALEKWIAPGILGAVVGFVVGTMSEGRDQGLRDLTVAQHQVLTAGGVLLLALTAYDFWRSDELERRLYHAAAAAAFFGTGLVTLVYGLMQRMGWPDLDWSLVFLVMVAFYSAGWWGAWLRYR
ncbi:MAG: hypothetical protein AB1941_11425 [Gemmatimonadota bacterium]